MNRRVSFLFCILLLTFRAVGESHTLNGILESRSDCKSGFGLRAIGDDYFGAPDRCLAKTNKAPLSSLIGATIKVRIHVIGKRDGTDHLPSFAIDAYEPAEPVGTTKKNAYERFNSGLGNVAEAMNTANGTYMPPPAATPTQVNSDASTYTIGVNQCIAPKPGPQGTIFTNICTFRVSLVWATIDGSRGSITLGPGDSGDGSMSNSSGGAKGQYQLYACPEFSVPVDLNNNPIRSMITQYRCMK